MRMKHITSANNKISDEVGIIFCFIPRFSPSLKLYDYILLFADDDQQLYAVDNENKAEN